MLVIQISNNSRAHRLESESSSPHNPYPPSSSAASPFCALPPWPLVCRSQGLPCLTDSGSPHCLQPPSPPCPSLIPPVEIFSSVPRAWSGT